MKKGTLVKLGLVLVPVGALLLNSCGPEAAIENTENVALDEASKDWGLGGPAMYAYAPWVGFTEYAHCNDGWDNDGNGLKDYEDPECHMGVGPLRDLSLYPFPQGHNYYGDISKDLPGSPGYGGSFRDPAMTARWLRFLTELDGSVAGIDLLSPGVNPEIVPFPEPLPFRVNQGTAHQGNNNNLDVAPLHEIYLDHDFLAAPVGASTPLIPAVGVNPDVNAASSMHDFKYLNTTQTIPGWGPKGFYNGGSQGAIVPARTGNPDAE